MRTPTKKSQKRLADKLFADWIKREGICAWCVMFNEQITGRLECAHIFSRRYLVTRWYEPNALPLCSRHHRHAHDNPLEFAEFVKKLYGSRKYYALMRKAHMSVKKVNLDEIIQKYQSLLEK